MERYFHRRSCSNNYDIATTLTRCCRRFFVFSHDIYAVVRRQAPAAIRALTAVFRPLMYPRPYLAPYVPALVELSLPGIDANDVLKTSVTLQLYHLILCWLPVQSNAVR